MFLKNKIEITPPMIVFVSYIIIFMFYVLSTSAYIEVNNNNQANTITELKIQQSEIVNDIVKIDTGIKELQSYSASFNIIMNELEDLKETTYEIKAIEFEAEMSAIEKIKDDKEKWFLEYKDICERYQEYVPMPLTIYDFLTEEEINRVLYTVQTEIGSGSFDAKVNVADVIWNRIDDSRWPNEVLKVIVPGQFAYNNTNVTESTRLAVEYSFMFPDQTNGALAFHSMEKTDTFGRYTYLFSDSAHHFYGEWHEK